MNCWPFKSVDAGMLLIAPRLYKLNSRLYCTGYQQTQLVASKSWVNQMSPYVLKIGGWLLLFFPSSDILTTTKHRDPPNINRFWSAVSALSSHQWGKFVWVFSRQVQWPQHSSPGWSLPAQVQSCPDLTRRNIYNIYTEYLHNIYTQYLPSGKSEHQKSRRAGEG